MELSIHKVALKPVSAHLYSCLNSSLTNDGTFERLQKNLHILEKNGVEELGGSAGVGVPDSVTLERIQQKWASIHQAYSPNKKVQILLKICKSIYHSMTANSSSGSLAGSFFQLFYLLLFYPVKIASPLLQVQFLGRMIFCPAWHGCCSAATW